MNAIEEKEVWVAIDERPKGRAAAHDDGDRSNNCLSNLNWITQHANILQKQVHGTQPKGESHPGRKLNDNKVRNIRVLREEGWTLHRLSEEFGVTLANIGYIVRRKTWRHVT